MVNSEHSVRRRNCDDAREKHSAASLFAQNPSQTIHLAEQGDLVYIDATIFLYREQSTFLQLRTR